MPAAQHTTHLNLGDLFKPVPPSPSRVRIRTNTTPRRTELLPPQTATEGLVVLAASARDAVMVPQSGLKKYFTCGFSPQIQPGARLLHDNNTPAPFQARLSHNRLILGARGSQRQYLLLGPGGNQCLLPRYSY